MYISITFRISPTTNPLNSPIPIVIPTYTRIHSAQFAFIGELKVSVLKAFKAYNVVKFTEKLE